MSLDEILKKNCTSTSILGPCEPYVGDLQVMGGNSGEDGSVRVGHLNLVSSVQVGQWLWLWLNDDTCSLHEGIQC